MIKQAIRRGTVLKCIDVPAVAGKNYIVVDFSDAGGLILASMDAIAENAAELKNIGLQDFWNVSNKFLQAHFQIA